ncbi:MAG: tRNA lysidine(34) synthetase TilS [Xanthobacteraceae bacterium]
MSAADEAVSAAEAKALFHPFVALPAVVLAVSGGPDSTALLVLAARWRRARKRGPKLVAVTVDHGLRRESAREARDVATLARGLGVAHRLLRWRGRKPLSRVQESARAARYQLLAQAAARAHAPCVLTGHTLDDQAETVLMRLSRGSGLSGLGAMVLVAPLPASGSRVLLARPLLQVPKARLIATLQRAGINCVQDPSNRDPRFARSRIRDIMPALAREGLDARRLATLARRLRRADEALEQAVGAATTALWECRSGKSGGSIRFDAERFAALPAEVALRLLGRAITVSGEEGPVELAKLEALFEAIRELRPPKTRGRRTLRRTLAGALVTRSAADLVIERAPARKGRISP